MVGKTCKLVVKEELKKMGLHFIFSELGMVEIMENLTKQQLEELNTNLQMWGLELAEDRNSIIINKIKNVISEMIDSNDELLHLKYSEYLSNKLHCDYTFLSHIFSEVNGISIQQFIINSKIERVKELIMYDELNLTEISYKLNYSSMAHLSNQFKQVTGLTPSFYKQLMQNKLYTLECV